MKVSTGILAISALAAVWLITKSPGGTSYAVFSVGSFIEPDKVADIAATFPAGSGDEFILAAWNYVGAIPYEPIASDVYFYGNQVKCLKCYMSTAVLERNKGNCVAKSALLISLLLNRLDPNSVAMVIGDVIQGGQAQGHAWLEVARNGSWYTVEATMPPPLYPWITVDMATKYRPSIFITRNSFTCNDPEMCFAAEVGGFVFPIEKENDHLGCGCGR